MWGVEYLGRGVTRWGGGVRSEACVRARVKKKGLVENGAWCTSTLSCSSSRTRDCACAVVVWNESFRCSSKALLCLEVSTESQGRYEREGVVPAPQIFGCAPVNPQSGIAMNRENKYTHNNIVSTEYKNM